MIIDVELNPTKNNSMASFYPIGTRGENKDFNWSVLTDLFICELYGIDSSKENILEEKLIKFEEKCELNFLKSLNESKAWDILKSIYFDRKNIAHISPKLRLYSLIENKNKIINDKKTKVDGEKKNNFGAERKFLNLMKNLFKENCNYESEKENLNFLEKRIMQIFNSSFSVDKPVVKGTLVNYFPNLTVVFSNDLEFITQYSQYFIDNIELFLQLYVCVYTIQLSLTINQWRTYQDTNVIPAYFLLDSERASRERNLIPNSYKKIEQGLEYIFPVLAMAESLQNGLEDKKPMWELYSHIPNIELENITKYCREFALDRKLALKNLELEDHDKVLNELERLFKVQFSKTESSSERYSRNVNVVKDIKNIVFKPFVKNRGSVGSIFTLKPEYLILLTNLAIGNKEQLRLHELLKEFEKRGVAFDKESQKALVVFYERLGNVEKMSDSGDAIYVKKTI